ncbi:uncharacterized protein LOC134810568 isoform X1 [Pan troglodytes]|uniref:uncharacterized protein LOC134810568 isoform X1 n=1 Tax=Pan troglodytes TaxID=9598 RepID=UPI003013ACC3
MGGKDETKKEREGTPGECNTMDFKRRRCFKDLPCKTCLSASTMIVRSLQPHVTEGVAIIHAIVKTSWQQNFQDWNCKDDYKGELHNQVFQDNEYFHSNKSLTINGYLDFHIFKEKSLNGN